MKPRAVGPKTTIPPLPSQDVSRYQAVDPPQIWPDEKPVDWPWVGIIALGFTIICVGLFAPFEVQLAVSTIIVVGALAALWFLVSE